MPLEITASTQSSSRKLAIPEIEQCVEALILDAVRNTRFGMVEIVIHDARIVQIESTQ
jgi:hypothetical protein